MRPKLILIFLMFAASNVAFAQPTIEWQYSLGGTQSDVIDHGNRVTNAMVHTNDGGYIIAGTSFSNDGDVSGHHGTSSTTDYWTVKLDSLGSIEWQKSLGGTGDDNARGVDETSDGGYIIIGESYSDDGDVSNHFGSADTHDIWVVKLDANANIEWNRSYGGSHWDVGTHIEEVNSGGYIFIGDTRSSDGDVSVSKGLFDIWVVRIDSIGDIIWEKSYGGSGTERPDVIRPTSDGGYIFSGFTTSSDGDVSNNQHPGFLWDLWVVKLDSVGTIQWEKTFGGSLLDNGGEVIETADGGYILSGWSSSSDDDISCNKGSLDNWVAKLDASGNIQWSKCYGGPDGEKGKSIRQTPDGGYLLGSSTQSDSLDVSSNNGEEDIWIVKIDSIGNIEWEETFGGSDFETISCAVLTVDGGIAFAGQSLSNDGDVTGHHGALSEHDIWMVKLSNVFTGLDEPEISSMSIALFPNPAAQSLNVSFEMLKPGNIEISVFDMQGRLIDDIYVGRLQSGSQVISWNDVSNIENGIYNVIIRTNFAFGSHKLIINK